MKTVDACLFGINLGLLLFFIVAFCFLNPNGWMVAGAICSAFGTGWMSALLLVRQLD